MDLIEDIKNGSIFVYSTDTIYGIGCDAGNLKSVSRIKKLKNRDDDKPLSVIAPSVNWIKEHCFVENWVIDRYLPGKYTLILKKKNPKFLSHISKNEFIGVRIPDCEFTKLVTEAGVPFITTSVNLSGEPFAISIKDIDKSILDNVDIVVDSGVLNGRPSVLVKDGREIAR